MRTLTHKLEHKAGRWSCACGYVLGHDGHKRLYARCPKASGHAYLEIKISTPSKRPPQGKTERPRPPLSRDVIELFDLARPQPTKKGKRKR